MFELMQGLPRLCSTIDRLLDRVPKDEMIAKYRSPEGLRIRIVIDDTEIIAQIREKKPEQELEPSPDRGDR